MERTISGVPARISRISGASGRDGTFKVDTLRTGPMAKGGGARPATALTTPSGHVEAHPRRRPPAIDRLTCPLGDIDAHHATGGIVAIIAGSLDDLHGRVPGISE